VQLLRTHDDFRRLWLAQTVSQIGSQVSYLAIPLTAAVSLDATPAEMGVLTALGSVPSLIAGLFAGAVVDRSERRPILISSDLARALLLAAIPAAWLLGSLNMPLLYLVVFLIGACSLFFDVAYQAFLPPLIDRDRLVEGNSGLELSRSAAEVAGPTLAGGLIQLLKAPLAIAVDALSFLASAVLVARIRTKESPRTSDDTPSSFLSDALAGLREVVREPSIRALAIGGAAIGLYNAMLEAVAILYLTRSIGMQPGILGLVFTAGSVGFVVGALLPNRVIHRFGIGPSIALSIAVIGLSDLALPLAGHNLLLVIPAVALGQFFFGLGITVYRVAQVSLRQALVPPALLGRVGGTLHALAAGTVPLGALLGGVLGQTIGLRETLVVAAVLEAGTALWILWSPIWSIREIEAVPESM
jgi:MFS family permease